MDYDKFPKGIGPFWRVRKGRLRDPQHAWATLQDVPSMCGLMQYSRLLWEIAPTGLPENKRCAKCLKALARQAAQQEEDEE